MEQPVSGSRTYQKSGQITVLSSVLTGYSCLLTVRIFRPAVLLSPDPRAAPRRALFVSVLRRGNIYYVLAGTIYNSCQPDSRTHSTGVQLEARIYPPSALSTWGRRGRRQRRSDRLSHRPCLRTSGVQQGTVIPGTICSAAGCCAAAMRMGSIPKSPQCQQQL